MEWRKIKDFPNFSVSDTGEIRNDKTGIIRKQQTKTDGYKIICLYCNGKRYTKNVHRIVLETFMPCEDQASLQVNHIDRNPANNNLSNLEWVTQQENLALRNSIMLGVKQKRKVRVEYLDGRIEHYTGIRACSKAIGINKDVLVRHLKSQRLSQTFQAYFYYDD